MRQSFVTCPGCGASVIDIPGRPHTYIGAVAGCWEIYGEILAKEFGEYRYPEPTHQLTVHTYAVQHPGTPGRRSTQSVTVHLAGLYSILEKGLLPAKAKHIFDSVLEQPDRFIWLEPPVPNGHLTVRDVVSAANATEHKLLVEKWARDVWDSWRVHHEYVRQLVESVS